MQGRKLAALGALGTLLLLGAPGRATAEKPFVFDVEATFVDTETYCVPVLIHTYGRVIERGLFGGGPLTLIEPFKTDYTNLETGKTVRVVHGGVVTEAFEPEGITSPVGF